MLPVFCSFSKISNLFVCRTEVGGGKIDMLRDVSCYGNITVVLKEHRLWTFGMWSWRFFTDLKCFETAVDCVGLCVCTDSSTSAVVSGDMSSSCMFLGFFC